MLLIAVSIITGVYLFLTDTFDELGTAMRYGVFQTVSIATTAGFTTHGYHLWPTFLPVLLLFMSFVGGCAGSTGGGLKVIRVLLLFRLHQQPRPGAGRRRFALRQPDGYRQEHPLPGHAARAPGDLHAAGGAVAGLLARLGRKRLSWA